MESKNIKKMLAIIIGASIISLTTIGSVSAMDNIHSPIMDKYIFLKIIIIINIIVISLCAISCLLVHKNNKKYLKSMLNLIITFIIQTVLIIGLNFKEVNILITIIAELLYLIYFVYQANKIRKMHLVD
ncbi:hypothetical protein A0J52_07115 [Clostridium sporogenes]|uniref:hypothetical protein n=1 Tax=Clostridium sporogenes TaxID=1509 RepID=UPI0007801856|nr:hypothetical protein [Clostridium sporogenes]KYN79036.1 hypothetical protein A0J52_07115 [Clostridium sporogenes]